MLILLALAAVSASASGQEAQRARDSARALVPGAHVRISASSLGRVTGYLGLAADENLVILVADGRTLTVPVSSVERLEVSAGSRDHGGLGLAIGLGVGLAAGIAAFDGTYTEDCGEWLGGLCDSGNAIAFLAIPTLTVGGALLGRAIGRAFKSERWEPASPERLKVGVTWVDGPAVELSVRF